MPCHHRILNHKGPDYAESCPERGFTEINKMKVTGLFKGFVIVHQKDIKIWSQIKSVLFLALIHLMILFTKLRSVMLASFNSSIVPICLVIALMA